jgi:hypothetical protein
VIVSDKCERYFYQLFCVLSKAKRHHIRGPVIPHKIAHVRGLTPNPTRPPQPPTPSGHSSK